MLSSNFKADWGLILLRLYIGAMFIFAGWHKVQLGRSFHENMIGFLRSHRASAYDFYWPFVEKLVLPHTALFSKLVAYGELAVGLGLAVGFMTRWASIFGALMMLNFWFVKGIPQSQLLSAQQHDIILFAVFVFLIFSRAGHVLGLDARYSERYHFLR